MVGFIVVFCFNILVYEGEVSGGEFYFYVYEELYEGLCCFGSWEFKFFEFFELESIGEVIEYLDELVDD